MFSDTHFHFKHMSEIGINGSEILSTMAARDCFFGLDIGTEADDLQERQACVEKAIAQMTDLRLADKARKFVYFSAGIWPSVEEIKDRQNRMKILEEQINQAEKQSDQDILNRRIVALGECGLDHHWNPSGVDGRCESDFDEKILRGEKEMFEMQLEFARAKDLPVIIHSRDAFEDTLDCIKNVGYDCGIIHCYSYGLEEAKAFLDRGWYISLSGGVTYTKKSKIEEMNALLRYIPDDRILCETDSPYLAPVPFRGQPDNPVYVEHTYRYVAQARGVEEEKLCNIVDENIKKLFKL